MSPSERDSYKSGSRYQEDSLPVTLLISVSGIEFTVLGVSRYPF